MKKPSRRRPAKAKRKPQRPTVAQILEQRGATYGDYLHESTLALSMQDAFEREADGTYRAGIANASPDQRMALRLMAVKIARLVNGDINHIDGWDDIAGYALLVANRLKSE